MNSTTIDKIAHKVHWILTLLFSSLILIIGIGLLIKSMPILKEKPILELLFSSQWYPLRKEFGFLSFIISSILVTAIALLIAIPLSLFSALYITEYARQKYSQWIFPLIDILAGIPSVVYGVWGMIVIVPLIRNQIAPLFGVSTTGFSILAAGIVLSVMIIPLMVNILAEVFRSIPLGLREASLSLGATKWETTTHVVLRKGFPGIIATVIIGLTRAFGETMAVLMVVGNLAKIPFSLLSPGYPLPALIANNYGEMMSIPLYDSAMMLAALILFVVVVGFNIFSRWLLYQLHGRLGTL